MLHNKSNKFSLSSLEADGKMISTSAIVNRPLTTKEIADQASAFQFNPTIPMKAWLRTAHTLNKEGESYLHDGNFAQAYLLFMRYMLLMIERLPSHPEAKTSEGKKALNSLQKHSSGILNSLENIKPILEKEYEAWESSELRRQDLRQKQEADRVRSEAPSSYDERASRDPALSAATRLLDAGEHQELAVELAQREIRRRDVNRKATRRAGVPEEEEQYRRTAGFWDNWTRELADKQAEDEELFRRQMELTRRRLDGDDDSRSGPKRSEPQSPPPPSAIPSNYHYPSITKSEPVPYDSHRQQVSVNKTPAHQPPRPPKEGIQPKYDTIRAPVPAPRGPELPAMEPIFAENDLPRTETPQKLPAPPPKIREDPSIPPKVQHRLTFKPAAYLENGEPVRPIFLPSQLRHRFLSVASENTKRGLEMCGILCGTAVNNALFVRCLLIPEQKCTTDTCETENEGAMLEYCMNEDLLMLGWIHTHPTQTCFMSSRDLHTQSGYQVMLPESIAVVCAPKFEPSYGIFRLTKPPGLDHILNCTQTATFHAHSTDNLYTGAQRPTGHVYESDNLEFYVQDLRPGYRNSAAQYKNT